VKLLRNRWREVAVTTVCFSLIACGTKTQRAEDRRTTSAKLEFSAASFSPLTNADASETKTAGITVQLREPNDIGRPSAWQGPMTITEHRTSRSCKSDVSLITRVYAAQGSPYLIVLTYSGSVRYIHYINIADCGERWPPTKLFTDAISISGNIIEAQPVCECPDHAKPCACNAAINLILTANAPPLNQQDKELSVTKKALGIAFTGQREVKAPGTPNASLISDNVPR
jgi:hypothetical protein